MIVFGENKIIMTDNRDEGAIEQLQGIVAHPAFKNQKVRIMPDYHPGSGSVIGFTSSFKDLVVPNVVGVDIGCGVITYPIGKPCQRFKDIDREIREKVPLGFNHHKKFDTFYKYEEQFPEWLRYYSPLNQEIPTGDIRKQIGTLGGGNHFIEIGKGKEQHYLTIHSGSRNYGLKVATYFQQKAKEQMKDYHIKTAKNLEYLPLNCGGLDYLKEMQKAQEFASLNRRVMLQEILKNMHLEYKESKIIESVHNYIDLKKKIIRKN